MSGITHRIVDRRKYDFASLGISSNQTIVVHRGIDCSMYREATLEVAVHVATLIDSTHTVQVLAVPVLLTESDPSVDFVANVAAATVLLNTTTQQSQVVLAAATANFGGTLQIQVKGTQPGSAAAFSVIVTIDISFKE